MKLGNWPNPIRGEYASVSIRARLTGRRCWQRLASRRTDSGEKRKTEGSGRPLTMETHMRKGAVINNPNLL